MKQFLFSLKKRKHDEAFNETRQFAMIKLLFRLPVEWQILFALLLIMALRLASIVVFIVNHL